MLTVLRTILRILLGLFFITTAVLKLMSLDSFEIYIYSFGLFGFNACAIVARLVIAAEMLIGIFLIAKILYKPTWWLAMLMLAGFTLFLVYVAIFRNDTNCHCMGDILEINPVMSIVKNVVTMLLMLLVRKEDDYRFKGKVAVGVLAVLASVVVPFVLFPTDAAYNLFLKQDNAVNEKDFDLLMQDSTIQSLHLDEGHYVFGVISAECKYCKLSARKIDAIVTNNQLDTNKVLFLIWGSDSAVRAFREETQATRFRYVPIGPLQAIRLVDGQFPTYIFVQDGKPADAVDIRGLGDEKIRDFLTK